MKIGGFIEQLEVVLNQGSVGIDNYLQLKNILVVYLNRNNNNLQQNVLRVLDIVNRIKQDLQEYDELVEITDHINASFSLVIDAIYPYLTEVDKVVDFSDVMVQIKALLSNVKEKKIFDKVFFLLTSDDAQVFPVIDFLIMYISFYKKTLSAVLILLERILLTTQNDLANFLTGLGEKAEQIHQIIERLQDCHELMVSELDAAARQPECDSALSDLQQMDRYLNDVLQMLFQILTPIQFHDRIKQYAKNLNSILFLMQKSLFFNEADNDQMLDVQVRDMESFGKQVMGKTNTDEERDMIKSILVM